MKHPACFWLVFAVMAVAADQAMAQAPTVVPMHYWHVWTNGDGATRQSRCEIKDFTVLPLGEGVTPILADRLPDKPARVLITQFPKGWQGTWHENPKPQWIVPLSGRWFVETMDGHRVEMGPGDAMLGEDQGSKPDAAGHSGHLSGTLGDEPTTLMFVQLDRTATPDDACREH